ncbi:chain-length determining protein [Paenarthrobacter sp. NPDC091711]|uniref:chain-length determining protein n=1 Tax=Paenarthrobacter sp. NPDC091711 TaxID=3364385 RepID=UPI0037FDC007
MDPLAVIKALWHHKLVVLPVLILTAFAAVYVYSFAPRSYEARATYAIVNPKVPSASDLERDPQLLELNSDNPYLRSSDSSLIAQVVATRLKDDSTGDALLRQSLSTDYSVERPPNSFLIDVSAVSENKETATATVRALGTRMEEDLRQIQLVNGAADRFLFTSILVTSPDNATELFSSRLRSLIVVVVGGLVLTFGAVSAARALETARNKSRLDGRPKRENRKARRGATEDAVKKEPPTVSLEELEGLAVSPLPHSEANNESPARNTERGQEAPRGVLDAKRYPGMKSPVGK